MRNLLLAIAHVILRGRKENDMKLRKLLVPSAVLAIWMLLAAPAMAATIRTAPFYGSSQSTLCSPQDSTSCLVSSSANRRTGVLTTYAERRAQGLSGQYGLAQAVGEINETAKPTKRARTVQVWINFRLDSAFASLTSRESQDAARVSAIADLRVPCTCPDNGRNASTTLRLADTDSSTPAPTSREGVDFLATLTVNLEPGESFRNVVFVDLRLLSQGILQPPGLLTVFDREAKGTGQVTVTSFEILFS